MTEARGAPVKAFFGAMLMGVGGLIATLSGLCTAFFLLSSLLDSGRGGPDNLFRGADVFVLALVVGGVPIGVGLGLFFLGRSVFRGAQPQGPAT